MLLKRFSFRLLGAWFMFGLRKNGPSCFDCGKSVSVSFLRGFAFLRFLVVWKILICGKFSCRQVTSNSAVGRLVISHRKYYPWTEVLLKQ